MSEHEGIWTEYRPTYCDGWSACKRMGDIVRCRDCRYASYDSRWCYRQTNADALFIRPDGFCAWGERMDA